MVERNVPEEAAPVRRGRRQRQPAPQPTKPTRDTWDKVSIFLPLVQTVVITLLGYVLVQSVDRALAKDKLRLDQTTIIASQYLDQFYACPKKGKDGKGWEPGGPACKLDVSQLRSAADRMIPVGAAAVPVLLKTLGDNRSPEANIAISDALAWIELAEPSAARGQDWNTVTVDKISLTYFLFPVYWQSQDVWVHNQEIRPKATLQKLLSEQTAIQLRLKAYILSAVAAHSEPKAKKHYCNALAQLKAAKEAEEKAKLTFPSVLNDKALEAFLGAKCSKS
jgi:hypothetical protein